MRRQFDLSPHVVPWRLPDAQMPADEVLDAACAGTPTALPLDVPMSLGGHEISSLAGIDFEVESWAPPEFPFADPTTRRVTQADLPRMAEAVRLAEEKTLGAGFDKPGPRQGPRPDAAAQAQVGSALRRGDHGPLQAQIDTAVDELRGLGAPVAKSVPLTLASVQPLPARKIATVLTPLEGPGAGDEPSEQDAELP